MHQQKKKISNDLYSIWQNMIIYDTFFQIKGNAYSHWIKNINNLFNYYKTPVWPTVITMSVQKANYYDAQKTIYPKQISLTAKIMPRCSQN